LWRQDPQACRISAAGYCAATKAQEAIGEVLEQYDKLGFSLALEEIWSLVAATDKYLTTEHPWSLGDTETDQQRRATILWTTAEVLRIVTALTHPVLPESTTKVWSLLASRGTPVLSHWMVCDGAAWAGTALGKSQALFPRIEKAEAIERMESMENEAQKQPSPVIAPRHQARQQLAAPLLPLRRKPRQRKSALKILPKSRCASGKSNRRTIVGADKLLKLTVDIGTEIRQICAGIAQFYEPEN